ncbi:hypothetical protein CORMATOL_02240 [Corynebacterium matruchotii ATCC 33806]|uniref:Uncharacterized protein n=1 Tax=Corynebacterium matruchotii ATCC 33806 TaxID=566549 RepID=C0E5G3_9CORY|nr:hypothetical protein CORMATOL_02240 [Corynebacterium matruchotii ATCC 33806]
MRENSWHPQKVLQLCYTHRFSVIILTLPQDNCSQSKIVTKN